MRLVGSVPFFPPPWPLRDLGRTLAVVRAVDELVTEDGEVIRWRTLDELYELLFDRELAVYVSSLPAWWPFEALRRLDGASVTCTSDGSPLALRVRKGRSSRTIIASVPAWGTFASVDLIRTVRACHAYLRVPLTSTAASMGQATIRRAWRRSEPVESRPNDSCWRFVRKGLAGGRADTVLPRRRFAVLWEVDINDAYLSQARKLPSGTAVYWSGARREAEPTVPATGFFLAHVTIPRGLPFLALGPFGVRSESGQLVYPTRPGTYAGVYLWWEDVELLRSKGMIVELVRGWYWRRWSRALGRWATRMHRLRRDAPPELAPLVKQAIVAAIGRFGGDRVRYRLTDSPTPGDRVVVDPELGPLATYVHGEPSDRGECLVHWSSYILAGVRRRLWALASPLAERGELVATNYDAVYATTRPKVRPSTRLGGVKLAALHDAIVPAARQIVAAEKVRLPGVAGGRQAIESGLQSSLGLV